MKHFVRVETVARPRARCRPTELPTRVKIVHQGSGQEFVHAADSGAAAAAAPLTTWNIPPAAKLGVYEVVARARAPPTPSARATSERARRERSWSSGNFRVEEFRLPLVDARAQRAEGACRSRRRASPSTCR